MGDHLLGGDLGPEERAFEIDVEHALVLLLGGVEHGGAGLHTGVVHHDVDASEVGNGCVDEFLEIGRLAHIRLHMDGLVTEGEHLLLEGRCGFRMDDIIDNNVRALLGEFENDGEADAAVASSDDGCFSFECHRSAHTLPLKACGQ